MSDQAGVGGSAGDPNGSSGRRSSVVRSIGANTLARVVSVPVSAVLGLIITRVMIDEYGASSYAMYALVVGIGVLLPFKDLGLGAAVVNATAAAEDPRDDERLERVLVSSVRLLLGVTLVVIVVAVVIAWLDLWPVILGEGLTSSAGARAATMCVVLTGLTLVLSLGQRLLIGLGMYVWVVALNALQTPIVLVVLLLMVWTGIGTGVYVAVVAYGATLVLTGLTVAIADRRVAPTIGRALRGTFDRTVRGAKVFDTAWPMLVQTVVVALAMGSDRVVLSHQSSVEQLAAYSIAAQMFKPLVGVIATASVALWPVFARARARSEESEVSPLVISLFFGAGALVCAGIVAALSGPLVRLASGGEVSVGWPLITAFVVLVVLQGIKHPLGMYLTDARGLTYQAVMLAMMLPVNVGLSWYFAGDLGAIGPVIGSIIGVLVFEVIANWWYVRRRLKKGRAHAA